MWMRFLCALFSLALLAIEAVSDEKGRMKSDVYGCERERKIQLGISNEVQSSLLKKKLKIIGLSALEQHRPRFFANRN